MSFADQTRLTYVEVLMLGPVVARGDIPALCERLSALLDGADVVVCDVSAVTRPDAAAVEALARLVLTARRHSATLHIRHAHRRLTELCMFVGLGDLIQRETEQREQPLDVEELVEPPDPPV